MQPSSVVRHLRRITLKRTGLARPTLDRLRFQPLNFSRDQASTLKPLGLIVCNERQLTKFAVDDGDRTNDKRWIR